jgi:hypothetical protein
MSRGAIIHHFLADTVSKNLLKNIHLHHGSPYYADSGAITAPEAVLIIWKRGCDAWVIILELQKQQKFLRIDVDLPWNNDWIQAQVLKWVSRAKGI